MNKIDNHNDGGFEDLPFVERRPFVEPAALVD